METIASACPWRSYYCAGGWDEFKTGRCLRCPTSGDKTKVCNAIGTISSAPSDESVNNMYYMSTGEKSPFCRYHWHVQLKIVDDKAKEQKGWVWVKLNGGDFIQLGEENFYIKSGKTYDFLITTKEEIKTVNSLELKWKHDSSWYEMNQWHIRKTTINPESVAVFSGEFQKEKKFCDKDGELKSKSSRTYRTAC